MRERLYVHKYHCITWHCITFETTHYTTHYITLHITHDTWHITNYTLHYLSFHYITSHHIKSHYIHTYIHMLQYIILITLYELCILETGMREGCTLRATAVWASCSHQLQLTPRKHSPAARMFGGKAPLDSNPPFREVFTPKQLCPTLKMLAPV